MFDWLKKKHEACCAGEMPQVSAETDLNSLLNSSLLVIFKHSTACPVSWAANSQINRFRLEHPDIPVKILYVIKDRPVSLRFAELSGVRHESPQVIVIREGAVAAAISHGSITADRLARLVLAPDAEQAPSGHPATT
jgi:bacillithiol system protein YtxJ